MDIRKIKKLIELIDETGVTEIEIQKGEESLRISKAKAPPIMQQVSLPSNGEIPQFDNSSMQMAPILPVAEPQIKEEQAPEINDIEKLCKDFISQ